MLNLNGNRDTAENTGFNFQKFQTNRCKPKKRNEKGCLLFIVFLVMGDVVIFDQPPVSEVRVSGQPSPHTGGSEPARPPPGPPRPARTAAAAARTAFLFSVTFLGTGFTFSLLTTPCGSAGDLLVPGLSAVSTTH